MKDIPQEQLLLVSDQILQRRKIEAIRIYRAAANVQLHEAKQAVEEMEAQMRRTSPEAFAPRAGRSIVVGVIVFVLLLTGLFLWVKRPGKRPPPSTAPAAATIPGLTGPAAVSMAGGWTLSTADGDVFVTVEQVGDATYQLLPKKLPFGIVYRLDGSRLVKDNPRPGFPGLIWNRVDADHFRLTNSIYRGATLTRVGATPLPSTQTPRPRPATRTTARVRNAASRPTTAMKITELTHGEKTSTFSFLHGRPGALAGGLFMETEFCKYAIAREKAYFVILEEGDWYHDPSTMTLGFTDRKDADIPTEFGPQYTAADHSGTIRLFLAVSDISPILDEIAFRAKSGAPITAP